MFSGAFENLLDYGGAVLSLDEPIEESRAKCAVGGRTWQEEPGGWGCDLEAASPSLSPSLHQYLLLSYYTVSGCPHQTFPPGLPALKSANRGLNPLKP